MPTVRPCLVNHRGPPTRLRGTVIWFEHVNTLPFVPASRPGDARRAQSQLQLHASSLSAAGVQVEATNCKQATMQDHHAAAHTHASPAVRRHAQLRLQLALHLQVFLLCQVAAACGCVGICGGHRLARLSRLSRARRRLLRRRRCRRHLLPRRVPQALHAPTTLGHRAHTTTLPHKRPQSSTSTAPAAPPRPRAWRPLRQGIGT